ncbi:MAG: discoidin domain-containing protein [Planctomycetes bacterium]|nr:discoidin domain-containing protein [Planctomycetota bacterium]
MVERSVLVRAAAFTGERQLRHGTRRTLVQVHTVANLALGKPVTASVPSGPVFVPARLTDGGTGNLDFFLGYPTMPDPIAVTIDLEEAMEIARVVVHTYAYQDAYESYELWLSSDGEDWRRVADRLAKPAEPSAAVIHDFAPTEARYVRILTHGYKGQVFDSFSKLTEVQVFGAAR